MLNWRKNTGLQGEQMEVYDQIVKAVRNKQAIESGLPDSDVKKRCMKYAELEKSLGEIDRSRALHVHASRVADSRSDPNFWKKWNDFEVQHGNEDTCREILRMKRSVLASNSQTPNLMEKDQKIWNFLKKAVTLMKDKVGIAQKEIPAAVFGELASKATEDQSKDVNAEDKGNRSFRGPRENQQAATAIEKLRESIPI